MKHILLSLRGGGAKGTLSAAILELIETYFGDLTKLFDLAVGTSTGGIQVCALGSGVTAAQMLDLYLDEMEEIFYRSPAWMVKSGLGVFDAKYPHRNLEKALKEYMGDKKLSESKLPIMTTSYDMLTGHDVLFKSWKDQEVGYTMVDAAMATSCAPTYFPPYEKNGMCLIDGGLYANNPALVGMTELKSQGVAPEDIYVLDIGTGSFQKSYDTRGWGQKNWIKYGSRTPIFDTIFSSHNTINTHMAQVWIPKENYLSLNSPYTRKIPMDETHPDQLDYLVDIGREVFHAHKSEIRNLLTR